MIPESVESIGVESFIYSDNLCSITFLGANTVIESGCLSDGNNDKITIYCKSNSNAEKFAQSCNIKYKYLG